MAISTIRGSFTVNAHHVISLREKDETYTSPKGGYFLLNLRRRALADRDTLLLSLRGVSGKRSSGQQALRRGA